MASPLDKLNKIPLIYKAIALIIVLVVVFAGFYFTSWTELDQKAENLRQEEVQLTRKYNEQKAVADNLPTFIENTKRLEDDLNSALKQLPRDKEVPTLLRDIYTLGKKSGVSFKTFEPQNQRTQRLYSELPVRLQISGKYHEIAIFFDRIGKMSRIVNVSDLDVNLTASKDKKDELSVNCNATTFMFTGGS